MQIHFVINLLLICFHVTWNTCTLCVLLKLRGGRGHDSSWGRQLQRTAKNNGVKKMTPTIYSLSLFMELWSKVPERCCSRGGKQGKASLSGVSIPRWPRNKWNKVETPPKQNKINQAWKENDRSRATTITNWWALTWWKLVCHHRWDVKNWLCVCSRWERHPCCQWVFILEVRADLHLEVL